MYKDHLVSFLFIPISSLSSPILNSLLLLASFVFNKPKQFISLLYHLTHRLSSSLGLSIYIYILCLNI